MLLVNSIVVSKSTIPRRFTKEILNGIRYFICGVMTFGYYTSAKAKSSYLNVHFFVVITH